MFLENAGRIWGGGSKMVSYLCSCFIKFQSDLVHGLGNYKFFLFLRMALNLFLCLTLLQQN